MAESAVPAPLLPGLLNDIVVWDILVRLPPPKSLLRCRAVSPAWRSATSTRYFLQAHHGRQPSLPIVCGESGQSILALDHRSANTQLQSVGRLDGFYLDASYDGLLILSTLTMIHPQFRVWNPATRQHAPLRQLSGLSVLGMYLHRPSGEYRLLLYLRRSNNVSLTGHLLPQGKIGCYVFAMGSDLPRRYIGGPEAASTLHSDKPALLRDSLHWSPVQNQSESRMVLVFDTATESFRQMRAPLLLTKSYIFEMDGTLAIYSYNYDAQIVDIWVLSSYEAEVWEYKYRVELPVTEIRRQLGTSDGYRYVSVVSVDGDVLVLVNHSGWIFYVDIAGKLLDSFHRDGQRLHAFGSLLKQTLVPHALFNSA